MSLSLGGGTIAIPVDGDGIYGGSGTVADGTVATLGSNSLRFGTSNSRNLSSAIGTKRDADNYLLTGIYEDVDGQFAQLFSGKEGDVITEYLVDYNGLTVSASNNNFAGGSDVFFSAGPFGVTIRNTYNGLGATYNADYSTTIKANARSIPDVGTVASILLDKIRSGAFSGVGTATTTFTVTLPATQPNNTYEVGITPTSLLATTVYYVTNKTTTTFDVVYTTGLTGTVTFDWIAVQ